MAPEVTPEAGGYALVEHDAQVGPGSGGGQPRQYGIACEFQRSHGLVARDGRKVLEKNGEWVPALEVINERLEWHSGADEHRRATENLWISMNDRLRCRRHGYSSKGPAGIYRKPIWLSNALSSAAGEYIKANAKHSQSLNRPTAAAFVGRQRIER